MPLFSLLNNTSSPVVKYSSSGSTSTAKFSEISGRSTYMELQEFRSKDITINSKMNFNLLIPTPLFLEFISKIIFQTQYNTFRLSNQYTNFIFIILHNFQGIFLCKTTKTEQGFSLLCQSLYSTVNSVLTNRYWLGESARFTLLLLAENPVTLTFSVTT